MSQEDLEAASHAARSAALLLREVGVQCYDVFKGHGRSPASLDEDARALAHAVILSSSIASLSNAVERLTDAITGQQPDENADA